MNEKVMFNGNIFLLKCLYLPKVGFFTEMYTLPLTQSFML